MNAPLVTVAPDDSLEGARALMEQRNIHHLLVMDGDRMAGILSSADLLKLALLRSPDGDGRESAGFEALGLKVRDVMQARVAVIREHASLSEAARALALGGFHALPVLAIDGTPVGIVTSSDLIGVLIDQIERDAPEAEQLSGTQPASGATHLLMEVLRAAEVYLHSGQSAQQHARLLHAVSRAREVIGGSS